MRVGTCSYVWWDPDSYRQPTSGHKHTYTEQVCIPPGHRCALNTRVLCTLVCFTSCDTCTRGERRVCMFTHRIMACAGSHSCARVLFWACAPPSVYSQLALSPGPPSSWFSTDGVVFDALVSAVTLNVDKCVCEEYRCCCLLLSV